MSSSLAFWIVVVGVGAINYALRLSFIALFAARDMPPFVRRALRYVGPAVLTAIVVPAVVYAPDGALALGPENLRVFAALAGAAAAWKWRSPTAAIVAGMTSLWILQAVTR